MTTTGMILIAAYILGYVVAFALYRKLQKKATPLWEVAIESAPSWLSVLVIGACALRDRIVGVK